MAVKYYRPRQQRGGGGGGIQIASTKRFLISIAIIAAIVVLIILLATQPWNAAGSEQNVPDEQASATDTVPAADTETADNVLDNPTEDTSEPAEATPSDTESADTATEAADTESRQILGQTIFLGNAFDDAVRVGFDHILNGRRSR